MMNSTSRSEAMDWEKRPGGMLVQRRDADLQDNFGPLIRILFSHGPAQHEVHVPAQSTFGYVKKILEQKTGLEPERQKILFRGQEKEDGEYLHEAGVKENSKLLVLEDAIRKEKKFEQMKDGEEMLKGGFKENEEMKNGANSGNEGQSDVENNERAEMSEAFQAIAVVRTEVDKLAERVAALEAVVNGGTRVAEDEFTVSSELLMRQLLKLDSIEAEGEARVQRKAEVRRVQSFHEILDNLKARNSKPFSNGDNSVTVTTNWETFDSGMGSLTPPPPTSSSIRITQDWESHSGAGACCYVAETIEPTTIRVWSPRTQIPGYIAGAFNENEAQSGSTCKLFGTPCCCLLNILLGVSLKAFYMGARRLCWNETFGHLLFLDEN